MVWDQELAGCAQPSPVTNWRYSRLPISATIRWFVESFLRLGACIETMNRIPSPGLRPPSPHRMGRGKRSLGAVYPGRRFARTQNNGNRNGSWEVEKVI